MWEVVGRYEDGTEIIKCFPYNEHDNYSLECERQYDLECWLIGAHEGCTFYSVGYVDCD